MTIRILTCDAGEEKPANETGPEGEGSPKAFWGNTGYPNLLYLRPKKLLTGSDQVCHVRGFSTHLEGKPWAQGEDGEKG